MKLLLDQNISFKLVERLRDLYPESKHVGAVGLAKVGDVGVWEYARENAYVIVSKDEDFHQLSFLYGPPPKAIWLSLGKCTTAAVEEVLRDRHSNIVEFVDDRDSSFLVLGPIEA